MVDGSMCMAKRARAPRSSGRTATRQGTAAPEHGRLSAALRGPRGFHRHIRPKLDQIQVDFEQALVDLDQI